MNPMKVPTPSPVELANQNQHSPFKYLSFNQDYTRLAAGTDSGFSVFMCEPFHPLFKHLLFPPASPQSGIGFVSMLFQCHIYALVGSGSGSDCPFPRSKVMIWDNHQGRCIGELSFRSEVISVKIRRDRIVVILLQKIFIYNFADLKLLHQIETIANPSGICEISHSNSPMMLICPGLQKGQVRVENYGSRRTRIVAAHDSRVACIGMTPDGGIMATASSKGTLVRIFNPLDGALLQEVRRGADRTAIHSIAISLPAQWLAVSSEKGTVHVFSLKIDPALVATRAADPRPIPPERPQNSSSLALFKGVLPKYFSSEWSVAQFRLPEGVRYVVGFGLQKHTVMVAGLNGSFYRCEFDPMNGGDMAQLEYRSFLNLDDMQSREDENGSVT